MEDFNNNINNYIYFNKKGNDDSVSYLEKENYPELINKKNENFNLSDFIENKKGNIIFIKQI
jgi:hypothetical protein